VRTGRLCALWSGHVVLDASLGDGLPALVLGECAPGDVGHGHPVLSYLLVLVSGRVGFVRSDLLRRVP
jgi:hypothetical protein